MRRADQSSVSYRIGGVARYGAMLFPWVLAPIVGTAVGAALGSSLGAWGTAFGGLVGFGLGMVVVMFGVRRTRAIVLSLDADGMEICNGSWATTWRIPWSEIGSVDRHLTGYRGFTAPSGSMLRIAPRAGYGWQPVDVYASAGLARIARQDLYDELQARAAGNGFDIAPRVGVRYGWMAPRGRYRVPRWVRLVGGAGLACGVGALAVPGFPILRFVLACGFVASVIITVRSI